MKYWILSAGMIFFISCSTTQKTASKNKPELTYRTKPTATTAPTSSTTAEKTEKVVVQPTKRLYYYSVLVDRFQTKKEAEELVSHFKQQFPLLPVTIRYETPRYKVYTGVYNSETAADAAAQKLRSSYPGAFSVQFKN